MGRQKNEFVFLKETVSVPLSDNLFLQTISEWCVLSYFQEDVNNEHRKAYALTWDDACCLEEKLFHLIFLCSTVTCKRAEQLLEERKRGLGVLIMLSFIPQFWKPPAHLSLKVFILLLVNMYHKTLWCSPLQKGPRGKQRECNMLGTF